MHFFKSSACVPTSICFCCTFLAILICSNLSAQYDTLRINEFSALNSVGLADEDGEYSDWIEIHNPTSITIGLQGWFLTDDETMPEKWEFPQISLAAGGYLVVFASGNDRTIAGNELHTDFSLNGAGEYLALADPSGTIVTEFSPSYPQQKRDVSYAYFDGDFVYSSKKSVSLILL